MKNLFLITGVSGSGKSHIEKKLAATGFKRAITSTTRPARDGEKDGVHYHFQTRQYMELMSKKNLLIETAQVNGFIYGMSEKTLKDLSTTANKIYIVLDPQGAETYQKHFANTPSWNVVTVFIDCPKELQKKRITGRLSKTPNFEELKEVATRLICSELFEENWSRMLDIDIYQPKSENTSDVDNLLVRINERVDKIQEIVIKATIPTSSYNPDPKAVLALIEELSAETNCKWAIPTATESCLGQQKLAPRPKMTI